MTRYLLDTDTCSYVLRKRPDSVRRKFNSVPMGSICISVVTYAELRYGAARSSSPEVNHQAIDEFVEFLDVLEWSREAADRYGDLRRALEKKGSLIGAMDILIAGHALATDAVLVTNNQKHFKVVPGLNTANWVRRKA